MLVQNMLAPRPRDIAANEVKHLVVGRAPSRTIALLTRSANVLMSRRGPIQILVFCDVSVRESRTLRDFALLNY